MTNAKGIRDRIVGLRRVRAGDLLANPRNWRKHPKAQQDAMRGVLNEIGYADALLAYETTDGLTLVDGHLRASLDPDQVVPVLILDIDEAEANRILATLDPLAAMAITDASAFGELFTDISFDASAVNEMLSGVAANAPAIAPSPLPPSPEDVEDERRTAALGEAVAQETYVPFTKPGQVWRLGRHTLFCDAAPGPLLGCDLKEALVLTDPPYGINIVRGVGLHTIGGAKGSGFGSRTPPAFGRMRQPGGKPAGVLKGRVHQGGRKKGTTVEGKPVGIIQPREYYPIVGDDKPFDPTWLLSTGKAQIIFGAPYFASKLRDGTAWIVWDKGVGEDATFSGFEAAWTSFSGRFRLYRHRWSGFMREGSRKDELVDRVHPTQKPVGLFAAILEDFPDYKVVVDPYLGSGTTLIACEKLGRQCYGVEIAPHYCDVIIKRWEQYTGGKAELLSEAP